MNHGKHWNSLKSVQWESWLDGYTVVYARSARQELEALDTFLISRIFPKIEALSKHPLLKGSIKL